MAAGDPVYEAFVEPGNIVTPNARLAGAGTGGTPPERMPQMPAFHLIAPKSGGISMINIGTGPSNARNVTDHVAGIRPPARLLVRPCARLRHTPPAVFASACFAGRSGATPTGRCMAR